MFFWCRSVAPKTAHVLTRLLDETSRVGSCPPRTLLAGRLGIADRVRCRLLDEQLDAGRELLADVAAARALTVVPLEAVPIRPVARSGRWALLAAGFATPHVLLAVDDSIWTAINRALALIGAACLSQKHTQSLHKTRLSRGNLVGGSGW